MTNAAGDAAREVWLRGNLRPVVGLAVAGLLVGAALGAAVLLADVSAASP